MINPLKRAFKFLTNCLFLSMDPSRSSRARPACPILGAAKSGIAANAQIAAMPPFNYACFRETAICPRAPADPSRTPGMLVTFRVARIGLMSGNSDLSRSN